MADYCIPTASQDIENAKRTAQSYIYSIIWNPTTEATFAYAGTVAFGVGTDPLVAGKMWQKQDDGCSTNWTEMAGGSNGSGVSLGVNALSVDGSREDEYVEDGSLSRPFKTIQAAVEAVKALNESDPFISHMIDVAPGVYAENVVLNGPGLRNLVIDGHEAVRLQPASGPALSSLEGNTNFVRLIVNGLTISGDIEFECDVDGGTMFSVDCKFRRCLIQANSVSLKNFGAIEFKAGQLDAPVTIENVLSASFEQQALQSMNVIWAPGNNKPATATYCFAVLNHCLTSGNVTVSAGAFYQVRNGSRVGSPGGSVNCSGFFSSFASFIRSNIVINAGGSFDQYGSFFQGTLTVDPGATYTNQTRAVCVGYTPAVLANWSGTPPTSLANALDRIAAALGPIA